ncbi:MAG: hypothetical protein JW739_08225 [Opitutales bacterium]|nr:hypothetical protein [Opitutales bacterium]
MNKPVLLCTVGTSPAVVFEAIEWCLGVEGAFAQSPRWATEHSKTYNRFDFARPEKVYVLGTEGSKTTDLLEANFLERYPALELAVSKGIREINTPEEQNLFDELLFNWYLTQVKAHGAENLLVCLAGGYKTMSASLQKAASLFGARAIFHVVSGGNTEHIPDEFCAPRNHPDAPKNPKCAPEAFAAWTQQDALFAPVVGRERGWHSFRQLEVNALLQFSNAVPRSLGLPGRAEHSLLSALTEAQVSEQRAARSYRLQETAFAALGSWDDAALHKLKDKVRGSEDRGFVQALPKVELHCHLGGFATHGCLRKGVVEAATHREKLQEPEEVPYPMDWPKPKQVLPLDDYMRLGDGNGRKLLRDPGCLKQHCELLYEALCNDRVVYAEIRCSPQNYAVPEFSRSALDVLGDIQKTFSACARRRKHLGDFYCQVNLLIIATRKDGGDLSDIARHLALAVTAATPDATEKDTDCRVVGVDLAGFEHRDTRAAYFAQEFQIVHRCGLAVTAHAGENDDAEGIWQAVYNLHTRRLGHALHLYQANDLMRTVADRQITVEMCPFANYQIKGFAPMMDASGKAMPTYPFRQYLQAGIRVTVNTDNMGISGANLTENLLFLATLDPELTYGELLQLQRNAVEAAFISPNARKALLARINRELEQIGM